MYVVLVLEIAVIASTICAGVILGFKKSVPVILRRFKILKCSLYIFLPLIASSVIMLIPKIAYAADGALSNTGLGFIAASLSTGLATIATGIAVGSVGSSALGAVSEDPKMLGRSLIYVGLAEGIAIYGLIISIMILGRI